MRSMPSSVSFWTTHSGRSPLDRREGDGQGRLRRRLGLHAAVAAGPACRRAAARAAPARRRRRPSVVRAQRPCPSDDDDLLAVAQAQHPAEVVGVLVAEGGLRRVLDEHLGGRGGPHGDGGVGGAG